jgi:hypothetical protein
VFSAVPLPFLVAASAVAVVGVAFTTLNLMRQFRLRRHLNRLRTMPMEHGGR